MAHELTERELRKQRARRLLELKTQGDERYIKFCFTLMLRSGKDMVFIEQKISEYADLA